VTAVIEHAPRPSALSPASDLLTARVRGRRRAADLFATIGLALSFGIALVPLGLVLWYVTSKGLGVLSWSFLTSDIPRQVRTVGPGMGPAVAGTLLITGAAALMAVPLGVLGAVYLNELGANGLLRRSIRFLSDVMTGVPSIVMGLFVYVVWVERFERQSGFAGALALACLMLPIVIRTTDEMLQLVPVELRQASVALGANRLHTTLSVVLPTALPGIVSGAMLAVARAAGETAPLLFTIGVVHHTSWSLSGPNTTLSAQIFRNASQPFPGAIDRAWGAALTLVLLVFGLSLIARLVASRCRVQLR
jgi:phosphate transport system permease protein